MMKIAEYCWCARDAPTYINTYSIDYDCSTKKGEKGVAGGWLEGVVCITMMMMGLNRWKASTTPRVGTCTHYMPP